LSHFPQGQGPFARFIVLRLEGAQTDLVGVFHHGICDGMSGVYVMRDLLQLLGEPGLILAPIPRQSNTRDLIPAAVRKNRFVRLKIKGIVAAIRLMVWFRQMRARWLPSTGQNPTLASPANQHMCILTQTLTVEQTAALVARCKAEQASVHAALSVAWLWARAIQLEKRKSWVRSASSPISLRERLGIPDTSGLYLANATIKVNCAPRRDFWNAAREFKKKLNQVSRDENLFLVPMIIGAVFSQLPEKDRKDVVPILFNRPVNYDFSITNLGRIDLPVKVDHRLVKLGQRGAFLDALRDVAADPVALGRLVARKLIDAGAGPLLVDLLAETGLVGSKSLARTTVSQGGAYVNNARADDVTRRLTAADLVAGRYVVLRRGKRDHHLVRFA